jgi:hypothetical protein
MTKKFDIPGRPARPAAGSPATLDRFIHGEEPMTTITVQIPKRLHTALKRAALDRDMKMKDLLIDILEVHLAETKQ